MFCKTELANIAPYHKTEQEEGNQYPRRNHSYSRKDFVARARLSILRILRCSDWSELTDWNGLKGVFLLGGTNGLKTCAAHSSGNFCEALWDGHVLYFGNGVSTSWKWLLLVDFSTREIIIYWTPSTSGFLPTIKAAFPRIRVKDRRWKSCLVANCSSLLWFLELPGNGSPNALNLLHCNPVEATQRF